MVIINFFDRQWLSFERRDYGFIQGQSLDISEIVTKTSTEPSPILLEEDDDIERLQEQKREVILESREKKFIMSLADIEVH